MLTYRLNPEGDSYEVAAESDLSVLRIVIPDTYNGLPVTKISADFFVCENLKEIVVGNNVTDTGYSTFDLPSLERIYFGRSVRNVYGPLNMATNLTDIYYSGTAEEWENVNLVFADDSISVIYNAKKHFGVLGKTAILSFGEEKIFPYTHWDCIQGKPETVDSELISYDNSTSGLSADNVKDAIDELNAKHLDFTAIDSWAELLYLVRSGRAAEFIKVGDQFVSTKGNVELVWDVIGIDADTPSNEKNKHSLTLQLHDCYNKMPFAAPEASHFSVTGLSAGQYYIKMNNYSSGPVYYGFTLNEALPSGGLIRISQNTVYLYSSRRTDSYTSFPVDSSSALEENMTGTFLKQENYHIHSKMGTTNYMESDIRKWLNSEEDDWWSMSNDRSLAPVKYLSTPGFCKEMDKDFLDAVNPVKKKTVLADGSEIVTEDKFFLLSAEEIYAAAGVPYEYYKENSSNSDYSVLKDSIRIKRFNSNATGWWLRTPGTGDSGLKIVTSFGEVSSISSSQLITYGVAPACCIC